MVVLMGMAMLMVSIASVSGAYAQEPSEPGPRLSGGLSGSAPEQSNPPAAQPETPPAAPAQPEPVPVQPAPAPSGGYKHIIVDLSSQWLYAYVGDYLVFDAPVSTGKDGFNTPPGAFSIYAKLPSQTMSGTLGGESYYVPDVPYVMYIYGGVAMHGTYWHNDFGTGIRRSHGCINLPIDSAAWLYNWAPIGTPVQVRW